MTWTRAAAVSLLLGLAACGGKGSPSSPTPPAVTVTGVTISTATDLMRVGVSETFAASATHSDGSVSSQITWSTSNPSVASVDASGKVSPLQNGNVDIIAAHDSATGRKTIRVVPNYQGTWTGRYNIVNCTNTGDYATIGFCSLLGSSGPIQLVLAQNRDSVSGTVYFGSLNTSVSGPLDSSGYMAVSADQIPGSFAITFNNWGLAVDGDRMTGHFTEDWRYTSSYMSGIGRFDSELGTVTRTSSSTVPATAVRSVMPRTLEEMARVMGIR